MTDMTQTPAHAKPVTHRDHLWVMFVIAIAAAVEVCATWVGIGNVSGFPVIQLPFRWHINTDFSLMVGMEAYGGFALYYWLSAAPGPRSRKFAMWSAIGALLLSLVGQISYHIMAAEHVTRPPAAVVGFVSALPVIVLGFAAILVHLVHLDREEAAEAERQAEEARQRVAQERAEADERTSLRAELERAEAAREAAESTVEPLRAELARAVAKAETLTRKLEDTTARKRGSVTARKRGAATARKQESVTGPETMPEGDADLDAEARVLKYLEEGKSASEAGRLAGVSDSRGRQIARLAKAAPKDIVDDARDPE